MPRLTRPIPAAPVLLWLSWPWPPQVNVLWTRRKNAARPRLRPQALPAALRADVGLPPQQSVEPRMDGLI